MSMDIASVSQLSELAWEAMRDLAQQAAKTFETACRDAGMKSFEAVVDEADTSASIVRHAHCSDLCVLSQADPSAPGHAAAEAVVEQVVLQCARQTLLIPHVGHFETIGREALVAWDDSREAARAVADALPLLRRARKVQVVCWREGEGGAGPEQLEALHRWLMWQGVAAEVRSEVSDIPIADALLSRAADLGSDLIVMGAYGHARWTEFVLGGATRGLLASMTAPVLMSH
jgi:nucleotide-binding universal stress UspA family protein